MNTDFSNQLNRIESKVDFLLSMNNSELTTSESATFLGISYSTMRNLAMEGLIPYSSREGKQRKHLRFNLLDLQKYKDSTMKG